jgi:hypothetical protein
MKMFQEAKGYSQITFKNSFEPGMVIPRLGRWWQKYH